MNAMGPNTTINTAMDEIRHRAYPLVLPNEFDQIFAPVGASGSGQPYTLDEQLKKLVGFIRQEHRREFLDQLALWKPYQPVTPAKAGQSKDNLPKLELVSTKEMRNQYKIIGSEDCP
jgi:hypothetical protein